ncbi:MAG: hypothetical protein QM783_01700 [Phycisphaerales bacterium]
MDTQNPPNTLKVAPPAWAERLAFTIVPFGSLALSPGGERLKDDRDECVVSALASWSDGQGVELAVYARPAHDSSRGGVLQWLRAWAGVNGIDLQHVLIREVGEPATHEGVTAFGARKIGGRKHSVMLAAFEDNGWIVLSLGSAPAAQWTGIENAISTSVESVRLLKRRGPTLKVDAPGSPRTAMERARANAQADYERGYQERKARREPAVAEAQTLMRQGLFDQAEAAINAVDQSIEGAVDLSRLYEQRLKEAVASGMLKSDRAAVEALFRRALSTAQGCYPEPHTEIEADNYRSGQASDRARLVAVLGYNPDA